MCKQSEYIERNALIASFNKIAEGIGLDCPWDITAIETIIESAPAAPVVSEEVFEQMRSEALMRHQQAVEAEEADKYGYWIPRHSGEWVDCSECGTMGSPHWKRCPVCEAKILPARNGDI